MLTTHVLNAYQDKDKVNDHFNYRSSCSLMLSLRIAKGGTCAASNYVQYYGTKELPKMHTELV